MIAATTLDSDSVILIRDYTNELMKLVYFTCVHLPISEHFFLVTWPKRRIGYSSDSTKMRHRNIKILLGHDLVYLLFDFLYFLLYFESDVIICPDDIPYTLCG